ncbi:MAK10-like protein [Tanacetum coccineum]
MGDENPIRTLGDYSKPSHEGYRNTIELPIWNNVVPLRSDTIRNWLERLPAGSITTWEDLTTRFLAQFFPPGRTAKLRNDILMFQQHHGESLSEAWTLFKDLIHKVPHHGIDLWLQVQKFYDHVNPVTRQTIDQSAGASNWLERFPAGSITTWEDLTTRSLAQVFPPGKTAKLRNDNLMFQQHQGESLSEAWTLVPHDTQYCMQNPKQAFVEYASLRTDEAGGLVSNFMASQDVRLSKFEADFKRQQSEMTNKINTVLKAITDRMAGALPSDTVKNPKPNVNPTTSVLFARSYPTEDPQCSTHTHGSINTIIIHPKQQSNSHDSKVEEEEQEREGNPEGTDTIAHNEEQRDTPQLELKDTTAVDISA